MDVLLYQKRTGELWEDLRVPTEVLTIEGLMDRLVDCGLTGTYRIIAFEGEQVRHETFRVVEKTVYESVDLLPD